MPTMTTAANKRHMDRVADLGCVVCGGPAAIHHVKPEKRRPEDERHVWRDDRYVLPLCPRHHQGHGWGVSLHDGEAEWDARHGPQADLLRVVAVRLGGGA